MDIAQLLQNHKELKEKRLTDRFFKHLDIVKLLNELPEEFKQIKLGDSFQGRSINLIEWGTGDTRVMLWSQMHGDEATGTMAIFDLFNYLKIDNELVQQLYKNCKLYMIPMVNPDGAEIFTRRNSQQIDINRDYLQTVSLEAKILKYAQQNIQPHFGFNLHDQSTLWSVKYTLKPATLSFLAPALDEQLIVDETRSNAMLIIADLFETMNSHLDGHIGLFDDEFEPRAFGDNFQKAGTATILIEAGGYADDFEKQKIRAYYFAAIVAGLKSIATKSYKNQKLDHYLSIPPNEKQIFHILIHHVSIHNIKTSIGINYEELVNSDYNSTSRIYTIEDIGDLNFCSAYQTFFGIGCEIIGDLKLSGLANFQLKDQSGSVIAFEDGKLIQNP